MWWCGDLLRCGLHERAGLRNVWANRGWCKDKWGVSWQITPRGLTEALAAGRDEAKRAFDAMMGMNRVDAARLTLCDPINDLRAAGNFVPNSSARPIILRDCAQWSGPSVGRSPRGPYHLSQSWLDGNIVSEIVVPFTALLRPSQPR
jgi:hypothetical protein